MTLKYYIFWILNKKINNDMAKNNALSLVSKSTAEKLVALINSKGIN